MMLLRLAPLTVQHMAATAADVPKVLARFDSEVASAMDAIAAEESRE